MGLTEKVLNDLGVLPNSAISVEGTDVGLGGMVLTGVVDEDEAPDMAREFAYGLAKKAYRFQREPVGRA
jgi:hypothetical protein